MIAAHPSHRVATDPVPRKPRRILTAPQFDALYAALPDSDAQLLVETAIETGLRWGELTELRAADTDAAAGLLTVSRAVIAVSRKHHPAGRRFWVKNYPKDRDYRQLRMSGQIVRKLSAHVTAHDLGAGGLLFARRGHSRLDRARPGRAAVPASRHDRVRAGPVPVRALPPRRRLLPGQAAPQRPRPAEPRPPCRGRPAHQRQHVPGERPPAGIPGRRNRRCHLPRPAPRARLMATRRRRGPPSREGATRPREDLDHGGVSAHPPRCGQTALAALGKIRSSTAHDDHGELQAARNEIEELKSALVSLTLKLHRPACPRPAWRMPQAAPEFRAAHSCPGETCQRPAALLPPMPRTEGRAAQRLPVPRPICADTLATPWSRSHHRCRSPSGHPRREGRGGRPPGTGTAVWRSCGSAPGAWTGNAR